MGDADHRERKFRYSLPYLVEMHKVRLHSTGPALEQQSPADGSQSSAGCVAPCMCWNAAVHWPYPEQKS